MTELSLTEGQAETGLQGATDQAPEGQVEQSGGSDQITGTGPDSSADTSFFDPKSVPEELLPAYKQMQGAFTKKMQAFNADKDKIDAYNQFASDPLGTLRQLATQYGFSLTQGQAAPASGEDWEPKTWDDVMAKATQTAQEKIMEQLGPVLNEVKQIKKTSLESQLDSLDPQWRVYEDDMMQNLQAHPTLVSSPDMLYRMSVPAEVIEARATQRALNKLQGKNEGSQMAGGSATPKKANQKPSGPLSFSEAVEQAKQNLAEKGLRPV